MAKRRRIEIPKKKIEEFCKKHHIRKLSFFGSVLREDFGPESDLDILVEFEPGQVVGLIRLAGMEIERISQPGFERQDHHFEGGAQCWTSLLRNL
jgi:hypothetical protein